MPANGRRDLIRRLKDIQLFAVSMEMQQWFPFALLSKYKIFRTAVNNDKH